MALSYQDAYAKIKALENAQVPLPLPAPTDAIVVGSIDAQSGAFTFLVPTFAQTITEPPPPGTKGVNRPINLTVGIVATNCVNLTLIFEVTNVPIANAPNETIAQSAKNAKVAPVQNPALAGASAQETAHLTVNSGSRVGVGIGIGVTSLEGGGTGDVTVSGFPSGGTQGSRILLTAGVAASAMLNAPTVSPSIATFSIGITVHGQLVYQHIAILRPPVLGVGAFTIPALPVAIVFAPPQGQLAKNSNTFNDKVTITTTATVSVSSETDTKTAEAYTPAELAAQVAGLLTQVAGLIAGVGSLGTSAGSSASLINVINGPPGGGSLNAVESASGGGGGAGLGDTLKAFGSGFAVLGDLISGLTTQNTSSDTSSITTTTNNTLIIAMTYSDSYGSEVGKGPGDGDRFIYLENVLALWSNVNGVVGLTVLGYDGVGAYSGDALTADQQALAAGGKAVSGLDAKTITLLLDLDPYYVLRGRNSVVVNLGPPLLGPPRFTPLSPLNKSGAGTSATGDIFSLATEQISDTSTTNTGKTINVTDTRPGWIDVLFGADNADTTQTVTSTNTVTTEQKTDQTVTNTVVIIGSGPSDPYNINLYYDNFSQTIVPVAPDSGVLQGGASTATLGVSSSRS